MIIEETKCKGLFLITPEVKGDSRGFFMEIYRRDVFAAHGIQADFVQENHTRSTHGVLRGLHFQFDPLLSKLIRVVRGRAYTVAVDIRVDSLTLGQWVSEELSDENKKQVYAPAGFATGFCVTGEEAEVEYHYSSLYNPKGESNIIWSDPQLNIPWPVKNPTLSPRDAQADTLEQWLARPESKLFTIA